MACSADKEREKVAQVGDSEGIIPSSQNDSPLPADRQKASQLEERVIPDSESPSSSKHLPAADMYTGGVAPIASQHDVSAAEISHEGVILDSQSPLSLQEPPHRKEVQRCSQAAFGAPLQAIESSPEMKGTASGPRTMSQQPAGNEQWVQPAGKASQRLQERTSAVQSADTNGGLLKRGINNEAGSAVNQASGDSARQHTQEGTQALEALSQRSGGQLERQGSELASSQVALRGAGRVGGRESPPKGSRRNDSAWEDSQDGFVVTLRRKPPTSVSFASLYQYEREI